MKNILAFVLVLLSSITVAFAQKKTAENSANRAYEQKEFCVIPGKTLLLIFEKAILMV